MDLGLAIGQIVISVLLVAAVMLQNKGAGLGQAFGGDSAIYSTRRGPEKTLFRITVILCILFVGISLVTVIIPT